MQATIVHEDGTAMVTGFEELEQRFEEQGYPLIRVWHKTGEEAAYTDYHGATITNVIDE